VSGLKHSLRGKTVFITGGSRGIGLAIALRVAQDGANVAIAAKTTDPHPKLPGTIYSAAKLIEEVGGRALPIRCDVRDEQQIGAAIQQTVTTFGGLDVCVNNASAVWLGGIVDTPVSKFDLMQQVNGRAAFLAMQTALPHLLRAENPHILTLSPPLNFQERWFAPHVAYSISKFAMSLVTLGVAGEYRGIVGINSLWPRTVVDTAALSMFRGHLTAGSMRSPKVMADAAHLIITADAATTTGHFFIDEEVLRAHGVSDLSCYAPIGVADEDLIPDLFV
jgi:citronellol/citronellal dehydrogenase